MHEIEGYLFDTQDCMVVEDVLDAVQVQPLLAGIPRHPNRRIERESKTKEGGGNIDFAHNKIFLC